MYCTDNNTTIGYNGSVSVEFLHLMHTAIDEGSEATARVGLCMVCQDLINAEEIEPLGFRLFFLRLVILALHFDHNGIVAFRFEL